ncbi:MAG: tryptophan synthase subunit alpha [Raoultibacter sp.]|jgi:tryptophan synthase alpha chain
MKRIAEAFEGKSFIAYIMAGDPDLDSTAEYILTAQAAGADLIEIGIPFSDPIAEGETIQAASIRALRTGLKLTDIFDMVESIRDEIEIPLVFMTYLNPVFVYGYDRFFVRCSEIGIQGLIIPDVPFEEQHDIKESAQKFGIEVISLIAPTSEERVIKIAQEAEGFIYLVSSMGVTGVRTEITTDLSPTVEKIRTITSVPIAIGFGISTPEQAATYSQIADGVIVGSAIVNIIGKHGTHAREPLFEYISSMKAAINRSTLST